MPQVTSNTQIDTINILQEANSANPSDYLLIQRGSVSYKLQKQNITFPSSQLDSISNLRVLGNVSGSSASPTPVTVLDSNAPDSNSDTSLVTEKRVKDYLDTQTDSSLSTNGYQYLLGGLLIQWGVVNNPASQGPVTVTFPIPFPNNCFNIQATATNTNSFLDNRGDYWPQIVSFTNSSATLFLQSSAELVYNQTHWFAIGN